MKTIQNYVVVILLLSGAFGLNAGLPEMINKCLDRYEIKGGDRINFFKYVETTLKKNPVLYTYMYSAQAGVMPDECVYDMVDSIVKPLVEARLVSVTQELSAASADFGAKSKQEEKDYEETGIAVYPADF
jgi:hypothetical protein